VWCDKVDTAIAARTMQQWLDLIDKNVDTKNMYCYHKQNDPLFLLLPALLIATAEDVALTQC
jgi:hypothetical protein